MSVTFTDRQLDVMNILWDRGSATVREAKEDFPDDLAYTSVLTVFQTLEDNGHVRHEKEGKAYRYYPTVSREEAARRAVDYLLTRLFRDAGDEMIAAVVESADLGESRAEAIMDALNRDSPVVA